MDVTVINHKFLNDFERMVSYVRMRRAQGIIVCAGGQEVPKNEYEKWVTGAFHSIEDGV